MKISGIYQIQSVIKPQRVYVGSSINVKRRWNEHLVTLKRGCHKNPKLQSHYNKYGKNDLVFSVLTGCDNCDLVNQEQFFLDSIKPWFNICVLAGNTLGTKRSDEAIINMSGENHPMYGKHHSEETKRKMKEAKKNMSKEEKLKWIESISGKNHPLYGKHLSDDVKEKISIANKGRTRSEEARSNISNATQGRIPWNKGIPHTEETKRRIKESLIGCNKRRTWKPTEEQKKKMIERLSKYSHKGMPLSEETKKKISDKHKGIPCSEEKAKKISEALKGNVPWNKGIPNSEETRSKIKESLRRRRTSQNKDK